MQKIIEESDRNPKQELVFCEVEKLVINLIKILEECYPLRETIKECIWSVYILGSNDWLQ